MMCDDSGTIVSCAAGGTDGFRIWLGQVCATSLMVGHNCPKIE